MSAAVPSGGPRWSLWGDLIAPLLALAAATAFVAVAVPRAPEPPPSTALGPTPGTAP